MKRGRARAAIGFVIGVALLGAALWAVASQRGLLGDAGDSVRSRPPWLLAAALALPLVNWLLISLSFCVLTGRYRRIGLGEMGALIGSAWLLNYLPMRPGLVGRVAYHKAVHGIAIRDSARVMVTGIVCALAAGTALLGVVLVVGRTPDPLHMAMVAAGLGAVVIGSGVAAKARGHAAWRLIAVFGIRCLDLAVWAVRYAVAFALIGKPVGVGAALAVGAVSQLASLIPLTGNGLGLQEWAVGLTASALHGADGTEAARAAGLAAGLVNRAAEILVAVPVGLVSAAYLARRGARVLPTAPDSATGP